MPNWCSNIMMVSGPRDEVLRFQQAAVGECNGQRLPLSFNALDPQAALEYFERELPGYPVLGRQYIANREKYGSPTWYEWCIGRWGTGMDPDDDTDCGFSEGVKTAQLRYSFSTAWAAPLRWLALVAADWPSLGFSLEWVEPSMDAAGRSDFAAGSLVYEKNLKTLDSFYEDLGDDDRELSYEAVSESLAP